MHEHHGMYIDVLAEIVIFEGRTWKEKQAIANVQETILYERAAIAAIYPQH